MLRQADLNDLNAIRSLVEDAFAPFAARIGVRPLPMDDDYAARIARHEVWVLGEMDGVIVLVPRADYLLVDNVAVRPALQGNGLGARLLAFAEQRAHAQHLDELRLYTNRLMTENRAFYARLGYEELEQETVQGRQAVWMLKRLGEDPGCRRAFRQSR
jgi:N-acetylglutamate synthase-like GNAT family acetyltransferase